jgi:hypothetical protein
LYFVLNCTLRWGSSPWGALKNYKKGGGPVFGALVYNAGASSTNASIGNSAGTTTIGDQDVYTSTSHWPFQGSKSIGVYLFGVYLFSSDLHRQQSQGRDGRVFLCKSLENWYTPNKCIHQWNCCPGRANDWCLCIHPGPQSLKHLVKSNHHRNPMDFDYFSMVSFFRSANYQFSCQTLCFCVISNDGRF